MNGKIKSFRDLFDDCCGICVHTSDLLYDDAQIDFPIIRGLFLVRQSGSRRQSPTSAFGPFTAAATSQPERAHDRANENEKPKPAEAFQQTSADGTTSIGSANIPRLQIAPPLMKRALKKLRARKTKIQELALA